MSKAKGARTERELLNLLWSNSWKCLRIAGSGVMPFPCPDLIAGRNGRSIAIECKSSKKTIYIEEQQVKELLEFARGFGAEPYLGIRFNNMDWYFLHPKKAKFTGKNYAVSKNLVLKHGITLKNLLK